MKKKTVELPLLEPLYSTYQNQAPTTAIIVDNPSIRNWYLNQIFILSCNRKFLNGFSTPDVGIVDSYIWNCPFLEKKTFDMRFLKGYTHYVIKNLLDEGYYVYYKGVDDYYIEGKSWYHEKHFPHDGCICGYNQENKTYLLYSYDKNWIYRPFWTSQKSFNDGMKAIFKQDIYDSIIVGLKSKSDYIAFSSEIALRKIEEYLDSSLEKYPESIDGRVFGIAVHDYIVKYLGKLYDGSIPYEKMDRRIFRLVWEHKKVMQTRIKMIEEQLSLDNEISSSYFSAIKEADNARMLYASHHMRRRDSLLPVISKKITFIKECESALLNALLEKAKGTNKK